MQKRSIEGTGLTEISAQKLIKLAKAALYLRMVEGQRTVARSEITRLKADSCFLDGVKDDIIRQYHH